VSSTRDQQRFTISQVAAGWHEPVQYRSTLCGHTSSTVTDNWTRGAASRHTVALISHTKPLHRSQHQAICYSAAYFMSRWGRRLSLAEHTVFSRYIYTQLPIYLTYRSLDLTLSIRCNGIIIAVSSNGIWTFPPPDNSSFLYTWWRTFPLPPPPSANLQYKAIYC